MRGVPSHVIGFDDAPFRREHRGDVPIVGAVYSGLALQGVLVSKARRDGANSTDALARMALESRFGPQLQAILLQGIAVAGFNVVDLARLHALTKLPVIVVARRKPDLAAIEAALTTHVPGGGRKWRLIQQAGPMEPLAGIWVQRAGITREIALALVERLAVQGRIPEPLRAAHLIAGALATGESRGRT